MKTNQKGFTLLELLVTISIIGILLAVGAVSFTTAQKRGRDSRRQADAKAIQKSLEQCYAIDTAYPAAVTSGSSLSCSGGEIVMNVAPDDPKSDTYSYSYSVSAANDAYCFCAQLENITAGNASDAGSNGICSFSSDDEYFCVSNQQ